jgi:hypothetical protein
VRNVVRTMAVMAGGCVVLALLVGCDGSDDSSAQDLSVGFISWTGNANGEVVMDGSDDQFKFRASDRVLYSVNQDMYFTNITVDEDGDLFDNGALIGAVANIQGVSGSCITGLVGLDRHYLDFYTQNGQEYYQGTSISPVACN